jgi:hypothetical protein
MSPDPRRHHTDLGREGQLDYIGGPTGGPYLMEPGTLYAFRITSGDSGVARCRSQNVKVLPSRFTAVTIVCVVK